MLDHGILLVLKFANMLTVSLSKMRRRTYVVLASKLECSCRMNVAYRRKNILQPSQRDNLIWPIVQCTTE